MSNVRHAFGRDIKQISAFFKEKYKHELSKTEIAALSTDTNGVYEIGGKNYVLFGNDEQPNSFLANTHKAPFKAKLEITSLLQAELKAEIQKDALALLQQVEKKLGELEWQSAENYYQAAKVAYTMALYSVSKNIENNVDAIVYQVQGIAKLPPGPSKFSELTAFNSVRLKFEKLDNKSINELIAENDNNLFRNDNLKKKIMSRANYYKYAQHNDLRNELIRHIPCDFIEARVNDAIFGIGKDGAGSNIQNDVLQDTIAQLGLIMAGPVANNHSTVKSPEGTGKYIHKGELNSNIKSLLENDGWKVERVKNREIYTVSKGASFFTVQPTQFTTNVNDIHTFVVMLQSYQAFHGANSLPVVTAYGKDAENLWKQAIAAVYPNNLNNIQLKVEESESTPSPLPSHRR